MTTGARAFRNPIFMPAGVVQRGFVSSNRFGETDCSLPTVSAELSSDMPFTTIISYSEGGIVCESRERRHLEIVSPSFRMGTITEIAGIASCVDLQSSRDRPDWRPPAF